ncbi:LysR substrate-binding domain-containing protein [Microbacterium sp. YY-01]|uniref:LysR substrate-binding domain-containing protein n=1 Tax=Microbacterium sp. YY-01 TaxID=3421634 RepID=UPI003D16CE29
MLEMRRLRLLREFQLRGTLAEVARALSYSPSLISQQMAILEREAGVRLLRRSGRRVQLTAAGELLATRAGELLDSLERTEAELSAFSAEIAGTVRIAVFQSIAHTVMPRAIRRLRSQHPALRLEMVEQEPDEGLFETTTRDFDLVVAEQYPGVRRPHRIGLDHQVLGNDPLMLVTPTQGPFATRMLADLAEAPWVAEPRTTASRIWVAQKAREAGFEPDVRFETADLLTQLRLIEAGEAVGILPQLFLVGTPANVRVVPLPHPARREVFSSTRLSVTDAPSITAVRAALSSSYAEILAEGF